VIEKHVKFTGSTYAFLRQLPSFEKIVHEVKIFRLTGGCDPQNERSVVALPATKTSRWGPRQRFRSAFSEEHRNSEN